MSDQQQIGRVEFGPPLSDAEKRVLAGQSVTVRTMADVREEWQAPLKARIAELEEVLRVTAVAIRIEANAASRAGQHDRLHAVADGLDKAADLSSAERRTGQHD